MERLRALDLFCGAGGAAMGLSQAGFDVVGIDIDPQPNYPFRFVQANALTAELTGFDLVWASPPCQAYSVQRHAWNARGGHPDLIAPVRARLTTWGGVFIIENVEGAPLVDPVRLCASTLDELSVPGTDGISALQRHRLFESNVPLTGLPCRHERQWPRFPPLQAGRTRRARVVGVWGAGGGRAKVQHMWAAAMGIDWMTKRELGQAIPPAYSRHLGLQVRQFLQRA